MLTQTPWPWDDVLGITYVTVSDFPFLSQGFPLAGVFFLSGQIPLTPSFILNVIAFLESSPISSVFLFLPLR